MKSSRRFRCGDPRTPENTYTYPKTQKEECRRCRNARQAQYRAEASIGPLRRPKWAPRVVRWISSPNLATVIAECRPKYEAAIAPKPVGRPRKSQTLHDGARQP